jgi:hypothetical protein
MLISVALPLLLTPIALLTMWLFAAIFIARPEYVREVNGREGFDMAQTDRRAALLVLTGEEEEEKSIFWNFFSKTIGKALFIIQQPQFANRALKPKQFG